MIFQTKYAIEKIVSGQKRQTRRLVKPAHIALREQEDSPILAVVIPKPQRLTSIPVYEMGHDYAVQSHRSGKGVWWWPDVQKWAEADLYTPKVFAISGARPLRIRILSIRQEDVRDISAGDVKAEGYTTRNKFLLAWCEMHDKQDISDITIEPIPISKYIEYSERYQAWVLDFEVVRS